MKDNDLDKILHIALSPDSKPDDKLNQKILCKIKENEDMMNKKVGRWSLKVAMVCGILLVGSVTVYAAQHYLSSRDIAIENNDKALAKAFESEEAIEINERQISGDYSATLLGIVSGENITDFAQVDANNSLARTYAVLAIERTDGKPMPNTSDEDYGKTPFFISPLINGLNPVNYNIATMNGGYLDVVRDGIMYRLIDCDNIELFADKGVSLCVLDQTFYNKEAYNYDEKEGTISRNKNYDGVNLLFQLPLDANKADAAKAGKYLKNLDMELNKDTKNEQDNTTASEENIWYMSDIDTIIKYGKLISEKTVVPDSDGNVNISYKSKYSSSNGKQSYDSLFFDGITRNSQSGGDTEKGDAAVFLKGEGKEVIIQVYEIDEAAALKIEKAMSK